MYSELFKQNKAISCNINRNQKPVTVQLGSNKHNLTY